MVPFRRLLRVGIYKLGEMEVLDRGRLVNAHGAIFPSKGGQGEIDGCEIALKLRISLSRSGLEPLALGMRRRGH